MTTSGVVAKRILGPAGRFRHGTVKIATDRRWITAVAWYCSQEVDGGCVGSGRYQFQQLARCGRWGVVLRRWGGSGVEDIYPRCDRGDVLDVAVCSREPFDCSPKFLVLDAQRGHDLGDGTSRALLEDCGPAVIVCSVHDVDKKSRYENDVEEGDAGDAARRAAAHG